MQKKATKILPALKWLPYSERLKACQIPTLHYRRIRGDMIERYKVITGKYQGCVAPSLIKEEIYVTRGNTQLTGPAAPSSEETASRPCRLQPKNRPILLDLSFWSSFDLKPFTVFTDTVSCSSIFHRFMTLSEKKCRRISVLQRCFTSFCEWPRVLLSMFSSK